MVNVKISQKGWLDYMVSKEAGWEEAKLKQIFDVFTCAHIQDRANVYDGHSHALLRSGSVTVFIFIEVEAIFPQVAACLLRTGLIRVKGICLLLLNILKYNSIYRVIYMLMQRLPLRIALTQLYAVSLWVKAEKGKNCERDNEAQGDEKRRCYQKKKKETEGR